MSVSSSSVCMGRSIPLSELFRPPKNSSKKVKSCLTTLENVRDLLPRYVPPLPGRIEKVTPRLKLYLLDSIPLHVLAGRANQSAIRTWFITKPLPEFVSEEAMDRLKSIDRMEGEPLKQGDEVRVRWVLAPTVPLDPIFLSYDKAERIVHNMSATTKLSYRIPLLEEALQMLLFDRIEDPKAPPIADLWTSTISHELIDEDETMHQVCGSRRGELKWGGFSDDYDNMDFRVRPIVTVDTNQASDA